MHRKTQRALLMVVLSGTILTDAVGQLDGPAAFPEAVREQIEHLVSDFRDAVLSEDPVQVADLTRLAESALEAINLAGIDLPSEAREIIRRQLPERTAQSLIIVLDDWSRHTLRFLHYDAAEPICSVLLRVIDSDGVIQKFVLTLRQTPDGWRIADLEDMALGTSVTSMSSQAAVELSAATMDAALLQSLRQLNQVLIALQSEDFYSASMALEEVGTTSLPEPFGSLRWVSAASIALAEYEPERALTALRQAEALNNSIPVLDLLRSSALFMAGEFEASLAAGRNFEATYGSDADAAYFIGLDLHYLEQTEEALAVLTRAAEETPESGDLVVAIGIALPDNRIGETADWFRRLASPWASFEAVADGLIDGERLVALQAILEESVDLLRGHPLLPWYQSEILVADAEFGRAADLVRPEIGRGEDDYGYLYRYRFSACMARSGRHMEAWDVLEDKPDAFDTLANELYMHDLYEALDELIRHHRSEYPEDSNSWWYEGLALTDHQEWEAAEEVFSTGQRKAEAADEEEYPDAATMRSMRITCLIRLNRILDGCHELGATDDVVADFAEQQGFDSKISELEKQLTALKAERKNAQAKLDISVAKIGDLEKQSAESATALTALTEKHKKASELSQQTAAKLEQAKQKMALAEKTVQRANEDKLALETLSKNLSQAADEAKKNIAQLETQLASAVNSKATQASQVSETQKSLESLQSRLEDLQRQLNETKAAFQQAQSALEAKQAVAAKLKTEFESAQVQAVEADELLKLFQQAYKTP